MDNLLLFFSFLLLSLNCVDGFPMNNLISKLPRQPEVSFRQFGGYIDVDEKVGRSLFYYFVEAEKDPTNLPLTIWLTGGPGCSSVSDGFIGVGPFYTTNNARALQRNLFSWNKVSNLLFIDSPIGSGWSYSNITNDYFNGDYSTNKNLLSFILKWYEQYPSFKSRDVYLGGTSYAGHFVPNFANTLLDYNNQSKDFKINIKGLVLGNPMLRKRLDKLATFDFFLLRGMINNELHQQIMKECNTINENNYSTMVGMNWTTSCTQLMSTAPLVAFKTDNTKITQEKLFDVLRDQCDGTLEDLEIGKEVTKVSYEVEMCLPLRAEFYFNLPEVQKAFHGNRTKLRYAYKGCFTDAFKYNESDKDLDMLPMLKEILKASIPITILSGDQDSAIPTMGTFKHLNKLAEELNFKLTKNEAWNHENKNGGWKYRFGDLLTLMTVEGANHHVTLSQPSKALFIFTNFILNQIH